MRNGHHFVILVGVTLLAVSALTGCELSPSITYQGRLTDGSGNPLSGTVNLTYRFYHSEDSGSPFYTETQTDVPLTDGLFDTVLGPTSASGLTVADLTEPIWVEVEVDDGTYVETLSPRQRLYGAPYAWTLMPGTYISDAMDRTFFGGAGVEAILNIQNTFESDQTFDALPILRIDGDYGIELLGAPSADAGGGSGTIRSNSADAHSDMIITSNDQLNLVMDADGSSTSTIEFFSGDTELCSLDEVGTLTCVGSVSAPTVGSRVEVGGRQHEVYSVSSPELWLEDFGTGTLTEGVGHVRLDPLFADAAGLKTGYHVFVTPLGDCQGLYVTAKTAIGFEVRELNGGDASIGFDYRIVAHRAGYEELRMAAVEPSLYEGE
jgi:hypothetical protein